MGMFSIFLSKLYNVVLTLPEQVHDTQISMMTLPDVCIHTWSFII